MPKRLRIEFAGIFCNAVRRDRDRLHRFNFWERRSLAISGGRCGEDHTLNFCIACSDEAGKKSTATPVNDAGPDADPIDSGTLLKVTVPDTGRVYVKLADPAVVARTRELIEAIGKLPVLCGPTPGYIVPRLQALVMNEAARMIEEGAATAEEIDKAKRRPRP